MPVTEEPRGLVWLNNANMASFALLVSQVLWAIGSIAFTWTACVLMLRQDGPSLWQGIPSSHEAHRQLGFLLAGALLAAWTGKTLAGVVADQQKRTADPRYAAVLEAKERGKVTGAAAALALATSAQAQANAMTAEHPVPSAVNVTASDQSSVEVKTDAAGPAGPDVAPGRALE